MPIFEVEDDQGNIFELEGDSPPSEKELEEIFAKPSLVDRAIGTAEVGANLVSGAVGEAAGGITGLATQVITGDTDAAVAVQEGTREALTFEPKTRQGQSQLSTVAEVAAPVGEILADAEQASGDAVFDATGSPEAGAIATAAPEAGLALLPVVGQLLRKTKNTVLQSKRASIGEKIDSGSTDNDTASFIRDGAGKVEKDPLAVESIRQGFDEGVVAAIKGASAADIDSMIRMVSRLDQGRKNQRFAASNRPSDIVGESLKKRVVAIHQANKQAGRRLDGEAKKLKGQQVDFSQPVGQFINDLDSIGVKFNNGKLDFAGSDLEGLRGPQAVLNNVVKRMLNTRVPDAFDIHRMKRFIDEQVTFGKTQRGLSGRTEGILKGLRRNLDQTLDKQFPSYKAVNDTFSETRAALDSFQDVGGRKLNLLGENADKAIGTLSRRLLSNAQSRVNLLDAIDELSAVAAKHGGKFNDDIVTQVMFVDELDSVFGPAARTSLQGDVKKAVKSATNVREAVVDAVGEGLERARGINEDAAVKAIRKLLAEQRASKRQVAPQPPPGRQLVPQ